MNTWMSLLIMFLAIYSVRMLPMIIFRRNITNPFIRSFLFYVPYVTLAVMTFPAILQSPDTLLSGIAALAVGLITAWIWGDLFVVAICCCVAAFLFGLI